MNPPFRRLLIAVVLILGLTISVRAKAEPGSEFPAAKSGDVSDDAIVAKGDGFEIRRKEMDQVLATAKAQNPQDPLPADAEIHVIDQLIEVQLVLQKATDAEKAEGMRNAESRLAFVEKTLGEAEFQNRLKGTHMTSDDLRLKFYQEGTAQASLTRQLGVHVTEADAKKIFDANPGAYDVPEMARICEVLLLTTVGSSSDPLPPPTVQAKHKQILEIYKRVSSGEDIAALAKQYNEDPMSKDNGGVFSFRQSQMEFGNLAFSMKPGQISEVLTNEDGYRFFKLLEIVPAKKIEFAAVVQRIETGLTGQEKRRLTPAYITQLRNEAHVQILDTELEAKIAKTEAAGTEQARAPEPLNSAPSPASPPTNGRVK